MPGASAAGQRGAHHHHHVVRPAARRPARRPLVTDGNGEHGRIRGTAAPLPLPALRGNARAARLFEVSSPRALWKREGERQAAAATDDAAETTMAALRSRVVTLFQGIHACSRLPPTTLDIRYDSIRFALRFKHLQRAYHHHVAVWVH